MGTTDVVQRVYSTYWVPEGYCPAGTQIYPDMATFTRIGTAVRGPRTSEPVHSYEEYSGFLARTVRNVQNCPVSNGVRKVHSLSVSAPVSMVYGGPVAGVRRASSRCTTGEQVDHGAVRGPPLGAVAEGPVGGMRCDDALARVTSRHRQPTGDRHMKPRRINKDQEPTVYDRCSAQRCTDGVQPNGVRRDSSRWYTKDRSRCTEGQLSVVHGRCTVYGGTTVGGPRSVYGGTTVGGPRRCTAVYGSVRQVCRCLLRGVRRVYSRSVGVRSGWCTEGSTAGCTVGVRIDVVRQGEAVRGVALDIYFIISVGRSPVGVGRPGTAHPTAHRP